MATTARTVAPRKPSPAFLFVGNQAISLAIVQQAWHVTPKHVVLSLSRGREISVWGYEAEAVWALIESHKARAIR